MNVLVVGGAGYIGSVVVQRLLDHGHTVQVIDNLSTGWRNAVPQEVGFWGLPMSHPNAALIPDSYGSIDAVIHLGAFSVVSESMHEPEKYWQNNVVETLALLEAMGKYGVKNFVFSSSAAVYGNQRVQPITEDAPTHPINPYGATKLAVDNILSSYAVPYHLNSVSLRYFNVAGALINDYGAYGERHKNETHLIPNALGAVRGDNPGLQLYGTDYPTDDGTAVRDYIHVVDLADAHINAIEWCAAGGNKGHMICNLGSGMGYSVREVVDTIQMVTGQDVPLHENGRRFGDPAELLASNERARSELGWAPNLGLREMVIDAWEFANRNAAASDFRPRESSNRGDRGAVQSR